MLFNSIDFAIFLPLVFFLYWFIANKNTKYQNILIVVASYTFYGWWDWRFLALLFIGSIAAYGVGRLFLVNGSQNKRKILLLISLIVNLGLLGFFKYFNFFIETSVSAFTFLGHPVKIDTLKIILPIGISFYTFQILSYSIDIYKRKVEPTKDLIAFFAFVSFFPQLLAGPIGRATHLLPQFFEKRYFNYTQSVDGIKQILWGLVKKIVIADNCAIYANIIFNNSHEYSGSTLIAGAVFFTFQIYGDFSGYSDIAIGTSKLFGINLMKNFTYPYFSRDIAEFWRRWHISLTTWFRDYLYIPLGGSKGGKFANVRNIFIVFIISGFWHGASWTYIAWGAVNAIYFLPLFLLNKNRRNLDMVAAGRLLPTFKEFIEISITFILSAFAWIFFRANNIKHALSYISTIFSKSTFTIPSFPLCGKALLIIIIVICFFIIEWIGREDEYAIEKLGLKWHRSFRWMLYYFLCLAVLYSSFFNMPQPFIYFKF